jgi:tetratricopeptide (TPR) repeat protein
MNNDNIEKLLLKAAEFQSSGKWLHAVQIYYQIIDISPDFLGAYYELGRIYYGHHRYEAAEKMLETALNINPKDVGCVFLMGNIKLSKGQYKLALDLYSKVQKNGGNFPELFYNIGLTYVRTENFVEAEKYFKMTLEINPDFPGANEILGELLIYKKLYNEAIKYLSKACEINAESWENHFALGQAYLYKKMWQEACEEFSIANGLHPNDPKILQRLGICFVNIEDFENSEFYFKQVLELNPHSVETMVELASSYINQMKIDEGIRWLHKAIEIDANNSLAWNELARAKNLSRKYTNMEEKMSNY